MKKLIRNLILLAAIAAIALMIVGILLYNFIPNDITVAKASTYNVSEETTKILSDAAASSSLLSQTTENSSSNKDTPTIVLQTYEITKSDLAVSQSRGEYVKGKSDPFADAPSSTDNSNSNENTTSTGGTTGNSSASTSASTDSNTANVASDGTLFNSTNSK